MVLQEQFVAVCDQCGAVSDSLDGPRQLAIVRLLRGDWLVRKDDTVACPACAGPPSVLPPKDAK